MRTARGASYQLLWLASSCQAAPVAGPDQEAPVASRSRQVPVQRSRAGAVTNNHGGRMVTYYPGLRRPPGSLLLPAPVAVPYTGAPVAA